MTLTGCDWYEHAIAIISADSWSVPVIKTALWHTLVTGVLTVSFNDCAFVFLYVMPEIWQQEYLIMPCRKAWSCCKSSNDVSGLPKHTFLYPGSTSSSNKPYYRSGLQHMICKDPNKCRSPHQDNFAVQHSRMDHSQVSERLNKVCPRFSNRCVTFDTPDALRLLALSTLLLFLTPLLLMSVLTLLLLPAWFPTTSMSHFNRSPQMC